VAHGEDEFDTPALGNGKVHFFRFLFMAKSNIRLVTGGGSTRQEAGPPGRRPTPPGRRPVHQAGGGSTWQEAGPPGRRRVHQAGGGSTWQEAGPPGRKLHYKSAYLIPPVVFSFHNSKCIYF